MTPEQHEAQKAMVLAAERLSESQAERHNSYPAIKPKAPK